MCEECSVWKMTCVENACVDSDLCGEACVLPCVVACVESVVCGECCMWRFPCVKRFVCGEYHLW